MSNRALSQYNTYSGRHIVVGALGYTISWGERMTRPPKHQAKPEELRGLGTEEAPRAEGCLLLLACVGGRVFVPCQERDYRCPLNRPCFLSSFAVLAGCSQFRTRVSLLYFESDTSSVFQSCSVKGIAIDPSSAFTSQKI